MRPENLATVAKQKGLTVHLTAPFSQEYGPAEFTAPEAFTKAAFGLTPDEPLAGPIVGRDAIYVIALAKQLPSEIPPLDQIRDRVTRDYQLHEGTLLAQAGRNQFCSDPANRPGRRETVFHPCAPPPGCSPKRCRRFP